MKAVEGVFFIVSKLQISLGLKLFVASFFSMMHFVAVLCNMLHNVVCYSPQHKRMNSMPASAVLLIAQSAQGLWLKSRHELQFSKF